MFESDQLRILLLFAAIAILPGIWLYRDVRKRGKSPTLWVGLYAFALVPPRFRYVLVLLVFIAWFSLRDRHFRFGRSLPGRSLLDRPFRRRRKSSR